MNYRKTLLFQRLPLMLLPFVMLILTGCSVGVGMPHGPVLTPENPGTARGGSVAVLHVNTHTIVDTVPVGKIPRSPAALPNGRFTYIPDTGGSNYVGVVDATSPALIDQVMNGPSSVEGVGSTDMIVLPDSQYAYAANNDEATVSIFFTETTPTNERGNGRMLKRLLIGAQAMGLARSPSGHRVYALTRTVAGVGAIAVINSDFRPAVDQRVVETISLPAGIGFTSIAAHPAGDFLYYSTLDAVNIVDIRDGSPTRNTVVGKVELTGGPEGIALSPSGAHLFVLEPLTQQVAVIDVRPGSPTRHSLLSRAPTGQGPRYVTAVENVGVIQVYIANETDRTVTVLRQVAAGDTYAVETTVSLAGTPTGIGPNPLRTANYVCQAPTEDSITFGDGFFRGTDWTTVKFIDTTVGAAATHGVEHITSGGNGREFRQTTHKWVGGDNVSRGLTVAHFRELAEYNPSTQGPIRSLDWSWDDRVIRETGGSPGVAVYPVLLQNGSYYGVYSITEDPSWKRHTLRGLTAADFGGATPVDFSASGGPIKFGYATSTATASVSPVESVSGIDNWMVTIHR
jgi:DNA-binding beta-propeller fold protein YncE